jgi:hypothetical protein
MLDHAGCPTRPVENRNWFSVADLIDRLREHDQAPSGGPDRRPEHADGIPSAPPM